MPFSSSQQEQEQQQSGHGYELLEGDMEMVNITNEEIAPSPECATVPGDASIEVFLDVC